MNRPIPELPLVEAVAEARRRADSETKVWDRLDRRLRRDVIRFIRESEGDQTELEETLLQAVRWARTGDQRPYADTWPYLLEILVDASESPSSLAEQAAVQGRAAEILTLVAQCNKPVRPTVLSQMSGLGAQHVNNLLARLEKVDLVVRQRGSDRASWVFATPQGMTIAETLVSANRNRGETPEPKAEEEVFWSVA